MYGKICSCFFPTTTVLVDDNKNFLKSFSHELNSRNMLTMSFNNGEDAYKIVDDHHKAFNFIENIISHPSDGNLHQTNIEIDIRSIYQVAFNPNRFRELSVIVVDYAMPGLNGLDFCTKIKDFPIKKILLTGEVDERIAVSAFNDQIIDRFIRKDSKDFLDVIEQTVNDLQIEYFNSVTQIITKSLTSKPDAPNHSLTDASFNELLNTIISKNNICECYLLDISGSYLLIDIFGVPSWLIVKEEDDLKSYYEIAEQGDAPNSVLDALKYKKMLPFFFTDADFNVHPSEWEKHMHPANHFKGKYQYYYAYVKNNSSKTWLMPKMRSYQQFVNSVK